MAFSVNEFQAALKTGGARNALFQVHVTNPINGIADINVPFMCKASQIPALTVGVVPVQYFGREVKLAGNRTYEPWTTTIINDEDFKIRNTLEQWSNAINSFEGNLRTAGGSAPSLYKSAAQVTQYSKVGDVLRVYDFVGLWPSEISTIELAWETEGIEEFTVTWQYDYWRVVGGVTGDAGGE